jgi:molybdenum-dependent DNA-binding transcriptional regulator ModE
MKPVFVKISEAARMLGISHSAAWSQVRRSGTLAGIPVVRPTPGTVRISRLAIEALAEAQS